MLLVSRATSWHGVGLSPDSGFYISAAKNLIAGKGLRCFDGTLLVSWPPLYPVLIAGPAAFGLDATDVARFINAAAFGLAVLLSGLLLMKTVRSGVHAVLGVIAIVVAVPMLLAAAMVWTEAVFVLLSLVFFVCLFQLCSDGRRRWLVLAGVAGALMCLQRYIGVVMVVAGSVALVMVPRRLSAWRRIRRAAVLLVISVLPTSAWLVRNLAVTSTFTGARMSPVHGFSAGLSSLSDTVLGWFVPARWVDWLGWAGVPLAVAVLVTLVFAALRTGRRAQGAAPILVVILAVELAVYVGALLVLSSLVSFDEVSQRLLAPVYVPFVTVAWWGVERASRRIVGRTSSKKAATALAASVGVILLLVPLCRAVDMLSAWRRDGVGVYDTVEWQRSPLVAWLRSNRLGERILSNDPAAVYLLAGRESRMSPRRSERIPDLAAAGRLRKGDNIVWFRRVRRDYLYTVQELGEYLALDEIVFTGDGGVLVVR